MINKILTEIRSELTKIVQEYDLSEMPEVFIEKPKEESHGDFSTNLAMRLAKPLRKSPVLIAKEIVEKLDPAKLHLEKVEVLNGFINFFIDRK